MNSLTENKLVKYGIGSLIGGGAGAGAGYINYKNYEQAKKAAEEAAARKAAEEQEAARKAAEESKGVFQRGIDKAKEYGDKKNILKLPLLLVLLLLLDLVLLLLERNLLLEIKSKK